ncbi:phosphatase PAP2 family protein [Maribellus sp. CM-23]|uniref:phosphatase PAP2 family protein n=1 Tax=Maribellus sp. CM-23 TaxID=2781026 RepID=UPI001F29B7E4|nr:phosphatase PAP2 family protein [Maribellus sp. CM-23]
MKTILLLLALVFGQLALLGNTSRKDTLRTNQELKFKPAALAVSSALITFGVIGLESDFIKDLNSEVSEEITEHIDKRFTIDDFSQYAPFVSVYALNLAGVEGKHNFRDRTTILATAYLLMGSTVTILKNSTNILRPDGSSQNSFPSGHTATAFMGAEFLYQEYKDVSVWYGISGYLVAAGTGFFRMYNNRHWLTDVATGAGIGMLSTKIAYWVHPFIRNTLFKGSDNISGCIVPYYNGEQMGLGMAFTF